MAGSREGGEGGEGREPPQPAFLHEVADQPRLLQRLLREAASFARQLPRGRAGGRLWLVGCGDMSFAARTAADIASCRGRTRVQALRAMDLRWWHEVLRPGDRVVAASISGRTPRTLEALALARRRGAVTVALTDDPTSPLAQAAAAVLTIGSAPPAELRRDPYAGYAHEVPQTRTYLGALAVLLWIADPTLSRELAAVPAALESARGQAHRCARELAALAARAPLQRVLVLASGPHAATASYGAAKLLEYAIEAQAQCLEEYHHLEMFVCDQRTLLLALCPDPPSTQRWLEAADLPRELGARTYLWSSLPPASNLPALPLASTAFLAAQALQLSAYELALSLGRNVNQWVGGVRRELIRRMSEQAVRGSEVRASWEEGREGEGEGGR